jgi:hypothetical protein
VTTDTRRGNGSQSRRNAKTNRQLRERDGWLRFLVTHAVRDIFEARFQFPTPESPSLRAYANVPEVSMPITTDTGGELAPDIVVIDTSGNQVKIHVAVETAHTVNEEAARRRWLPYSQLADSAFYIYVPVGYGGRAKRLCRRLGIRVYGFRTWRYTPHGLEINEVSERPGVVNNLLPPILKKLLR